MEAIVSKINREFRFNSKIKFEIISQTRVNSKVSQNIKFLKVVETQPFKISSIEN